MLQFYPAPPQWSHWVEGGVVIRMGAGQQVSRFPAMPRAMLTLHLARVHGMRWSVVQPATFHSLTTEPSTYTHAGDITAVGLIVRPSASACLLGSACGAVTNQTLPWHVMVGHSEANRLLDDMEPMEAEVDCLRSLMASLCRAMEGVALARWQQAELLCETVGRHGAQAGSVLGVGRRQLERRCMAVLGMAPKQLERLERFHRALSQVLTQDAAPLVHTALDAGYYDQSHLALEARRLGGAPLRELKAQAAPGTPWWALATPRAMQGSWGRLEL